MKIALPRNMELFNDHAKNLIANDRERIEEGRFLMYHFANGRHQVSIGRKSVSPQYALHDNLEIQAGNGASGGMII